jgi:hypothetical protein
MAAIGQHRLPEPHDHLVLKGEQGFERVVGIVALHAVEDGDVTGLVEVTWPWPRGIEKRAWAGN